jgi:hypothetical protein
MMAEQDRPVLVAYALSVDVLDSLGQVVEIAAGDLTPDEARQIAPALRDAVEAGESLVRALAQAVNAGRAAAPTLPLPSIPQK